jgi:hypothetical protein
MLRYVPKKHQSRPAGGQTPGGQTAAWGLATRMAYCYDPITTRDTLLIFRVWHGKFLTGEDEGWVWRRAWGTCWTWNDSWFSSVCRNYFFCFEFDSDQSLRRRRKSWRRKLGRRDERALKKISYAVIFKIAYIASLWCGMCGIFWEKKTCMATLSLIQAHLPSSRPFGDHPLGSSWLLDLAWGGSRHSSYGVIALNSHIL